MEKSRIPTLEQISAGGVAFRLNESRAEVAEARFAAVDEAIAMLAFKSERDVVQKAARSIAGLR